MAAGGINDPGAVGRADVREHAGWESRSDEGGDTNLENRPYSLHIFWNFHFSAYLVLSRICPAIVASISSNKLLRVIKQES